MAFWISRADRELRQARANARRAVENWTAESGDRNRVLYDPVNNRYLARIERRNTAARKAALGTSIA